MKIADKKIEGDLITEEDVEFKEKILASENNYLPAVRQALEVMLND